ncbi:MAG: translation initiation factor [Byssovorax sp.]
MGALDGLLEQVKQAITSHTSDNRGGDNSTLFGKLADMFGNHPHNNTPLPASQDRYGDPADQRGGGGAGSRNIKPASQDPYGDPGDKR